MKPKNQQFHLCRLSSPCIECDDRYPSCHDHCEKFINYRHELDEINEAARLHITVEELREVKERKSTNNERVLP